MKRITDKNKENQLYQRTLIAMILNDQAIYTNAIDLIKPELFTGTYRMIFDVYLQMVQKSINPDAIALSTYGNIELEIILDIATSNTTGVDIPLQSLIYELFDYMAKAKLSRLANNIETQITAGTDYESIISLVTDSLRGLELGNSASVITMEAGIAELYQNIINNRTDKPFTGSPVGMKIIDTFMGGLQPGNLIVLAGETSHGKTALALSMMFNSATMFGVKCGMISHEMTTTELMSRLSSYATGIGSKHLLIGKLSDDQVLDFSTKITTLQKSNIFIQDYIKRELNETLSAVRLMVLQHGVKWVVIENAGNINVKGARGNEERTAEISKNCKAIAKELNITVILVSHLSRHIDGKKCKPDISRLRHSGQLENDADIVMFIYRPEIFGIDAFVDAPEIGTKGRVQTFIAKGRNVGLAESYQDFNENTTYVSDHQEYVNQNEYKLPANPNF